MFFHWAQEGLNVSSHYFAFSSVQFSRSLVSDSLLPYEQQHARPPCPSPTPGVYPDPCPLSWWCHPTISSSVIPFSSHLQSCSASWSFQMSQFFASGGQSIRVSASASIHPMNIQDWFPLGWAGWISLQSKRLSRVFSAPQLKSFNSLATLGKNKFQSINKRDKFTAQGSGPLLFQNGS